MIVTLLIILAVIVGCDSYICFCIMRQWPIWAKIVWWIPSVLFFVCAYLTSVKGMWGWPAHTLTALLLCIIVPKLAFTLISLIGKLTGLAWPPLAPVFNLAGLALAIVICMCAVFGLVRGWKKLVVNEVEIETPALPEAFRGFRIVQLSDLHLGTFGKDTTHVAHMVDMVNNLQPDLIVFTGDLVNFNYKEVLPFKEQLSRFDARKGVVSILGNHDYALYERNVSESTRDTLVKRLIDLEREMGWKLLLDENMPISRGEDTIWIAGVQNIGRHFAANKGDLRKALAGIPDGGFTILLSHDPTHWDDSVFNKTTIPLTLSGHTHAMQLKVLGWSPSGWAFKHWGGHYEIDGQHLFVSVGAGGNLPFRFGAWPEIDVLRLDR